MTNTLNAIAALVGWLTIVLTLCGMLGVGNFVYYYGFGEVIIIKKAADGADSTPAQRLARDARSDAQGCRGDRDQGFHRGVP